MDQNHSSDPMLSLQLWQFAYRTNTHYTKFMIHSYNM